MNTDNLGRVPSPVNAPHLPLAAPRGAGGGDPPGSAARRERAVRHAGLPRHDRCRVARRAKVSVDTLYASVGRKPQLLLAVHDMVLGSADEPSLPSSATTCAAIRAASGARAKLTTYAEALGRVFPHTVPLAESLRVAAQTDADCRKVWDGLNERRAANMLHFARELRETGELREELTDEEVAHLVWMTNCPEYYRLARRAVGPLSTTSPRSPTCGPGPCSPDRGGPGS